MTVQARPGCLPRSTLSERHGGSKFVSHPNVLLTSCIRLLHSASSADSGAFNPVDGYLLHYTSVSYQPYTWKQSSIAHSSRKFGCTLFSPFTKSDFTVRLFCESRFTPVRCLLAVALELAPPQACSGSVRSVASQGVLGTVKLTSARGGWQFGRCQSARVQAARGRPQSRGLLNRILRWSLSDWSSFAAILCAIDCTVLPAFTALLPFVGLVTEASEAHENIHHYSSLAAVYVVLPLGLFALLLNYSQHRRRLFLLWGLAGLSLVFVAHCHHSVPLPGWFLQIAHRHHAAIGVFGSVSLISCNYLSHKAIHHHGGAGHRCAVHRGGGPAGKVAARDGAARECRTGEAPEPRHGCAKSDELSESAQGMTAVYYRS